MTTASPPDAPRKAMPAVAAIVLTVLAAGYAAFRPAINEATGWNPPAVAAADDLDDTPADTPTPTGVQSPATVTRTTPPLATPRTQTDSPPASDLVFGLLRRLGNDRYLSPEGLIYAPGSAEGHRIEHLKRHVADQPTRPGRHGVFDGGLEAALATIDLAYKKAKAGSRTTKRVDQGRTIYTVDMGKRIGFVGGRDGGRQRNPMARRVRLVLQGTRVITAYPM